MCTECGKSCLKYVLMTLTLVGSRHTKRSLGVVWLSIHIIPVRCVKSGSADSMPPIVYRRLAKVAITVAFATIVEPNIQKIQRCHFAASVGVMFVM
jgi:hypothetical protein